MNEQIVRVLFHLNGYTKAIIEVTEGVGLTDFGVSVDIPTESIPTHLRSIGTRFRLISHRPTNEADIDAIRYAVGTYEIVDLTDK